MTVQEQVELLRETVRLWVEVFGPDEAPEPRVGDTGRPGLRRALWPVRRGGGRESEALLGMRPQLGGQPVTHQPDLFRPMCGRTEGRQPTLFELGGPVE